MLRYAITDRSLTPGDEPARTYGLLQQAEQLAEAGVDFVLLRERDLAAAALAALARQMLAELRRHAHASKLLLHSRADIALAVGADGVHLTSTAGSLTPAQIRRLYAGAGRPHPVVSLSCHTLDEVARARSGRADLILFGPVFEKRIGGILVSGGAGLGLLHQSCATAGATPVLALGGVAADNTAACLAAGAAGIAAIRLFARHPEASRSVPPSAG